MSKLLNAAAVPHIAHSHGHGTAVSFEVPAATQSLHSTIHERPGHNQSDKSHLIYESNSPRYAKVPQFAAAPTSASPGQLLTHTAQLQHQTSDLIGVRSTTSFLKIGNLKHPAPPLKPVAEMSTQERIRHTLQTTAHYAPDDIKNKLMALASPEAAIALAAYAGAHAIGVGFVFDVPVLAALLVQGTDVVTKVAEGVHLAANGTTPEDLNLAGKKIADALTSVTADAVGGMSIRKWIPSATPNGEAIGLSVGKGVIAGMLGAEPTPLPSLRKVSTLHSKDAQQSVHIGQDDTGHWWAVTEAQDGTRQHAQLPQSVNSASSNAYATEIAQGLLDWGLLFPEKTPNIVSAALSGKVGDLIRNTSGLYTDLKFDDPPTALPKIIPSADGQTPDRLAIRTPQPRRAERSGYGASWHNGSSDDTPNIAYTLVPNIVFEWGAKSGFGPNGQPKGGDWGSVTPQPILLFVPQNSAAPGFKQETYSHALHHKTEHAAGFYPGDPRWPVLQTALKTDPDRQPEWRTASLGRRDWIRTEKWDQDYLNVPNVLQPLRNSSYNYRQINWRTEHRATLFNTDQVIAGKSTRDFFLAPYSWMQLHQKSGITSPFNKPNGQSAVAYSTTGNQLEVGLYLAYTDKVYDPTNTLPAKPPKDWRIVKGKITSDPSAMANEFADIKNTRGIALKSESVVPDWNDNHAAVYIQVPGNATGANPYISAATLAETINSLGREFPRYKELAHIRPADLSWLNSSNVVLQGTGPQPTAFFKAGDWVRTGAYVARGHDGLALPQDIATDSR